MGIFFGITRRESIFYTHLKNKNKKGLSKNALMVSLKKFKKYIVHKIKTTFNNVCKCKLTHSFLKPQFFKEKFKIFIQNSIKTNDEIGVAVQSWL